MKHEEEWKILTIRASESLREKTKERAEELGLNVAEYVRRLIENDTREEKRVSEKVRAEGLFAGTRSE